MAEGADSQLFHGMSHQWLVTHTHTNPAPPVFLPTLSHPLPCHYPPSSESTAGVGGGAVEEEEDKQDSMAVYETVLGGAQQAAGRGGGTCLLAFPSDAIAVGRLQVCTLAKKH